MDGKSLLRKLRLQLQEHSASALMDNRYSYELLWEAAIEFVYLTGCLSTTTAITTVADQTSYDLPVDFLRPWMQSDESEYFARYYDGTNYSLIPFCEYDEVYALANTTSVTYPNSFSIVPEATLASQVTGTATSDGNKSGGQCILTDTAATFITTDQVAVGDVIHNTTDVSSGIVLSITNATHLVCALFDGTDQEWDSNDAYIIQPQSRLQMVLDPPPSTAGHIITLPYIQRPNPVFSDYGTYKGIAFQWVPGLIHRALTLYFERIGDPQTATLFDMQWQRHLDRALNEMDRRTTVYLQPRIGI